MTRLACCMGFKTVAMDTLLLQRPNQSFNEAILLRGIGCDEFLLQAVTFVFPQYQIRLTGFGDKILKVAPMEGVSKKSIRFGLGFFGSPSPTSNAIHDA